VAEKEEKTSLEKGRFVFLAREELFSFQLCRMVELASSVVSGEFDETPRH
jgi:hypothetical protein